MMSVLSKYPLWSVQKGRSRTKKPMPSGTDLKDSVLQRDSSYVLVI